MTGSTKTTHSYPWLSRLIASLTIGLMMLALAASTAFAGTGNQTKQVAGNAAPVVSTGGDQVTLDADDEDDEDDDDEDDEDEEGGGGGGLPATDTAPLAGTGQSTQFAGDAARVISTGGDKVALNEDDEDDEDEEGGGGGGLPATDTAPLAASGGASGPIPAVVLLMIAGLAGGAATVAAKRSIRP
jgi:hypothetical protein